MKQQKRTTALFDFDGVIVDTEPIYDAYWKEAGKRYGIENPHFFEQIRGTTLPDMLKTYFSDRTEAYRDMIAGESIEFEQQMPLPPIEGALQFMSILKRNGIKIGLVTSSVSKKMERALRVLQLEDFFETIVSADRITKGKPNPACYLLAAEDLKSDPADCLVFEDSFAGIQAAKDAGMRVIALSTTNSAASLQEQGAYKVIRNFRNKTIEDYLAWSK